MKKLVFALLLLNSSVFAQDNASPSYPQNYFRNPLEIPIFLAGNFGECRPGHFHSGMDIKTQGVENKPVHAAAEGYISRIKMEKGGFGHALYITHPNGYTTLYAHLNDFAPAIQRYVRRMQYDKKRWDVDLQLNASDFPVKKGEQIAWSGNTGASTAPHLHFEIRNTRTEHPLNPQLFGFVVVDRLAPVPAEVVLYTGNVYEGFSVTASLAKKGDAYRPVKTDNKELAVIKDTAEVPAGVLGIGINADDYMEGSDNTITFYTARLYMDDSLQSMVALDDIGYDVSRYVNAYTDYRTKQQKHKWVQLLFQLPGNDLNVIYPRLNANKGRIDLSDGKPHKINIVLTDDGGNVTNISFIARPKQIEYAKPAEDCMPFYARKVNDFAGNPNIQFSLDGRQLYDDICFHFKSLPGMEAYSDRYALHYPFVPLHHYFELQLKPTKTIPIDLRSKVVMMYSDGKDEDGRAAAMADNGWYKANVRNFGTFWLDVDTTPPVIKSMQKNSAVLTKAKQITFEVRDAVTSVKNFGGYLDGNWLCFEQHGSSFFYKFDEHCPRGKHELVFKAEDENGNSSTYKLNFTR